MNWTCHLWLKCGCVSVSQTLYPQTFRSSFHCQLLCAWFFLDFDFLFDIWLFRWNYARVRQYFKSGDFNIHICCSTKALAKDFFKMIESFNLCRWKVQHTGMGTLCGRVHSMLWSSLLWCWNMRRLLIWPQTCFCLVGLSHVKLFNLLAPACFFHAFTSATVVFHCL